MKNTLESVKIQDYIIKYINRYSVMASKPKADVKRA